MVLTPQMLQERLNSWPTFTAQNISVTRVADDWSEATVRMELTEENGNYYGTAFGGTMFSMVDPFFVILAAQQLGTDFMVWDKSAGIDFLAPGRSAITAHVQMPPEVVASMRSQADDGSKVLRWFNVDFVDESDNIVAQAQRQLYVRRKKDGQVSVNSVGAVTHGE